MKITKIEVFPVSIPRLAVRDAHGAWDWEKGIYDPTAAMTGKKHYVITKVHTDEGIVGLGEGDPVDPSFYGETQETIVNVIRRFFAPMLLGKNPLNTESIMAPLEHGFPGSACAKCALDIALFDIAGKAFGVPVYTLLGGIYREKIPVALEVHLNSPEEMARVALEHVEQRKVGVLKVKVGVDPQEDIERVRAVREAVGGRTKIRVDGNCGYSTKDAIRFAKGAEKYDLELIEQPVGRWDIEGLARIRSAIGIPLEVDESVWSISDALNVIRHKAADIINIKITRVGGLTNARKIAAIAEAAHLECLVGTEGEFGVGTAAKIHLALATKNMNLASEFTEYYTTLDNIWAKPIAMQDGFLGAIHEPGLGVELDEEKMRIYTRAL